MPTKAELYQYYTASVTYFRAYQCSCVAENHGVYDPTDDCYYGWRYEESGNPYDIVGLNYRQFSGHFNPGLLAEAQCNFMIFDDVAIFPYIGVGDLLVSDDQTVTRSCILDINEGNYNPPKNKIPDFDVDVINADNLIVSYKDNVYLRGTDYTVSSEGGVAFINWVLNPPEKYYMVKYVSKVHFIVWDVLPAIESTETDNTYKSVICKLRKFGAANDGNLIDRLNFAPVPAEYINI